MVEEPLANIRVLLTFDFAADSALAQIKGQVDYIATVPYQKV